MTASMSPGEITALLGRGTRFDGKLHFEGVVRIDGAFRGEIKSPDTLMIERPDGKTDVLTLSDASLVLK